MQVYCTSAFITASLSQLPALSLAICSCSLCEQVQSVDMTTSCSLLSVVDHVVICATMQFTAVQISNTPTLSWWRRSKHCCWIVAKVWFITYAFLLSSLHPFVTLMGAMVISVGRIGVLKQHGCLLLSLQTGHLGCILFCLFEYAVCNLVPQKREDWFLTRCGHSMVTPTPGSNSRKVGWLTKPVALVAAAASITTSCVIAVVNCSSVVSEKDKIYQLLTMSAGVAQCVRIQRRKHDGSIQFGDLFWPDTAAGSAAPRSSTTSSPHRWACPQHPDPPGRHLPRRWFALGRFHVLWALLHRRRGRVRSLASITYKTRLPSSLRQDYPRMHAFSWAWSLPVTWHRCQSHRSIHRSRKPHATCRLHRSVFCRIGLTADQSFTLREYGILAFCSCELDFDPMTFIYALDTYPLKR